VPLHGLPASAALDLAPLSAIYLEPLYWQAAKQA
jgi:hypothetical protein